MSAVSPHNHTHLVNIFATSSLLSLLRCLCPVLSSPIRVLAGPLASTPLINLYMSAWETFINLPDLVTPTNTIPSSQDEAQTPQIQRALGKVTIRDQTFPGCSLPIATLPLIF